MNMTGREDKRVLGNNKDGAAGRRGRLAGATAAVAVAGGKTRHTHVALEQREGPAATSRTTFPRVRRDRIFPEIVARMSTDTEAEESKRVRRQRLSSTTTKKSLKVDTTTTGASGSARSLTPRTEASSTPSTPNGVRGASDLRSPGVKKTPRSALSLHQQDVLPDFITQTDKHGNATTPRSVTALQQAQEDCVDQSGNLVLCQPNKSQDMVDVCAETFLDSLRIMCCCLIPDEGEAAHKSSGGGTRQIAAEAPRLIRSRPALLPKIHSDDCGKKCLVLDLDETLVHSSFRAVPGADFVIPVQIEDVVHFVYVAKRPGVDEFLIEMAKHYELVIYTASLNKYADPLLDLLDTNRVIRSRLFRESCVYHEGNYVKDLSKLDRDLSQTIIIDNSPNSYAFHPENAIDCSSFIDDPRDRELDHIGAFLTGLKDVRDVRGLCHQWREWPHVQLDSQ